MRSWSRLCDGVDLDSISAVSALGARRVGASGSKRASNSAYQPDCDRRDGAAAFRSRIASENAIAAWRR